MQIYILRGIEVQFPYDAYACQVCTKSLLDPEAAGSITLQTLTMFHVQLDYMDRVLQALQEVCFMFAMSVMPLLGHSAT